jgi:hypothetical protein
VERRKWCVENAGKEKSEGRGRGMENKADTLN